MFTVEISVAVKFVKQTESGVRTGRLGVSIFFGCPDREIRCPDSLGRKFPFSWVSRHPTNVFGHGSG
jgi:hypothetical protein